MLSFCIKGNNSKTERLRNRETGHATKKYSNWRLSWVTATIWQPIIYAAVRSQYLALHLVMTRTTPSGVSPAPVGRTSSHEARRQPHIPCPSPQVGTRAWRKLVKVGSVTLAYPFHCAWWLFLLGQDSKIKTAHLYRVAQWRNGCQAARILLTCIWWYCCEGGLANTLLSGQLGDCWDATMISIAVDYLV